MDPYSSKVISKLLSNSDSLKRRFTHYNPNTGRWTIKYRSSSNFLTDTGLITFDLRHQALYHPFHLIPYKCYSKFSLLHFSNVSYRKSLFASGAETADAGVNVSTVVFFFPVTDKIEYSKCMLSDLNPSPHISGSVIDEDSEFLSRQFYASDIAQFKYYSCTFKNRLTDFLNLLTFNNKELIHLQSLVFYLQFTCPLYRIQFKKRVCDGGNYNQGRLEFVKRYCYSLGVNNTPTLDMSEQSSLDGFMSLFYQQYLHFVFVRYMMSCRSRFGSLIFSEAPNFPVSQYCCMFPVLLNAFLFGTGTHSLFITVFRDFYHHSLIDLNPEFLGDDYFHADFLLNVMRGDQVVDGQYFPFNSYNFSIRFLELAAIMLSIMQNNASISLPKFIGHLYELFPIISYDHSQSLCPYSDLPLSIIEFYGSDIRFANYFLNNNYPCGEPTDCLTKDFEDLSSEETRTQTHDSDAEALDDNDVEKNEQRQEEQEEDDKKDYNDYDEDEDCEDEEENVSNNVSVSVPSSPVPTSAITHSVPVVAVVTPTLSLTSNQRGVNSGGLGSKNDSKKNPESPKPYPTRIRNPSKKFVGMIDYTAKKKSQDEDDS